jgi:hypothetical protein
MKRTLDDGSPAGYGRLDREMAQALGKAPGQEEADKIARDNGLRDARDARDWLASRS